MTSRISSGRTRGERRSTTTSFDFMEDTPLGPGDVTSASGACGSDLVAIGASGHRQKIVSLVELLQELSMPHRRQSSTARGWIDAHSSAQTPATKDESARETTLALGASYDRRQQSGWETGAASPLGRLEHVENNETSLLPSFSKPIPTSMGRAADAPSTKPSRVAFVTQVDIRQQNPPQALEQQRQGDVELSPRLPGQIRAIVRGDCFSNHENDGRSSESGMQTTGTGDHFGNVPDTTIGQRGSVGTFAGSVSRCCPSISPKVADVGPAPGKTNSSQEPSARRKRLHGGHADNLRALKPREDGKMNQWLTQVDSGTSDVCEQKDSVGDSARQKTPRPEYEDRTIQAIGESRGWKPVDRDRPDVVPIGLQHTAGVVFDGDPEPRDEELTHPSMDDPSSAQECNQAEGNRGDLAKELLGVRGLCRVKGVIVALVEWKVVDADGVACQELSFMLSSTLKVDWPHQYIAYLEGKLVFRSEDGIEKGQNTDCT